MEEEGANTILTERSPCSHITKNKRVCKCSQALTRAYTVIASQHMQLFVQFKGQSNNYQETKFILKWFILITFKVWKCACQKALASSLINTLIFFVVVFPTPLSLDQVLVVTKHNICLFCYPRK